MKRVRNGAEFAKARELLGFSKTQIAQIMRLADPKISGYRTVSRWETGDPSGPAMLAMEALLSGWRPLNWKGK